MELVIASATTQTAFFGSYEAVEVGSEKYIFVTLESTLLFYFFWLRSRCKHDSGRADKLNYSDVKRALVASSAGGTSIADARFDAVKLV